MAGRVPKNPVCETWVPTKFTNLHLEERVPQNQPNKAGKVPKNPACETWVPTKFTNLSKVQIKAIMTDEEDNRIKSTKTWIKWNSLEDGTSMKYGNKMFVKPEQSEQLIIEIKQRMKTNDAQNARETNTYRRRRVE